MVSIGFVGQEFIRGKGHVNRQCSLIFIKGTFYRMSSVSLKDQRHVVIVGAVPASILAAINLLDTGIKVTLIERNVI